ncbi:hypothetical protein E4U39_006291 [Claviceps sp. Clav50 group G5]|nr:hypothetical protein E4U39_006291 [Claviceps sp. Clav50 group G5]
MQLLSAILVVATASVASAAVASPDLVDRGLNGPYCDRGSPDSGACEAIGLHGYCATFTCEKLPIQEELSGVGATAAKSTVPLKIWAPSTE